MSDEGEIAKAYQTFIGAKGVHGIEGRELFNVKSAIYVGANAVLTVLANCEMAVVRKEDWDVLRALKKEVDDYRAEYNLIIAKTPNDLRH